MNAPHLFSHAVVATGLNLFGSLYMASKPTRHRSWGWIKGSHSRSSGNRSGATIDAAFAEPPRDYRTDTASAPQNSQTAMIFPRFPSDPPWRDVVSEILLSGKSNTVRVPFGVFTPTSESDGASQSAQRKHRWEAYKNVAALAAIVHLWEVKHCTR